MTADPEVPSVIGTAAVPEPAEIVTDAGALAMPELLLESLTVIPEPPPARFSFARMASPLFGSSAAVNTLTEFSVVPALPLADGGKI